MTLALFDLDNTLLNGDSDHAWGSFLVRKQLVDAEAFAAANERFYGQYKAGQLDIHEYNRFALRFLSEHDRDYLQALHQQFMQEDILPMIGQAARELVQSHRKQGHTLVIITATNHFVTAPIAAEFGIEHLLAINPKMANGRIVAEIDGVPSFREGKITRLQAWLAGRDETLAGSYFYSDSHNDLPLLEIVEHPVAVDPDPVLQDIATERGWAVISLHSSGH
ncbi:MAG: HAD family hydrolase [Thiolinea sp.]